MDLNQNYFSLFQLPQQFTLDERRLKERFRQLQREVHPDRHLDKGMHQQRLAVQFASYINTAYQTLKSPLSRAEYLLELAQTTIDAQSMTVADSRFLLQQMQWRDILSDATKDQCKQTAKSLRSDVSAHREQLIAAFVDAYNRGEFDRAKETVAKLHFVEKMMTDIERAFIADIVDDGSRTLRAG